MHERNDKRTSGRYHSKARGVDWGIILKWIGFVGMDWIYKAQKRITVEYSTEFLKPIKSG
jgi:hypothetical protein